MQLTEHFSDTELSVADINDVNKMANAKYLCALVLEPLRMQFGPIDVHCGYRAPAENAAAHGVNDSEHLFELGHAAADISFVNGTPMRTAFDWLCNGCGLPFGQAILEYDDAAHTTEGCLHVSADRLASVPRREALIGMTGNREPYVTVTVK